MPGKQGKRGKRPDTRPARWRYWGSGRLKENKVRRLMRSNGMTRTETETFWVEARGGRRMRTSPRGSMKALKEQNDGNNARRDG